MKIAWGGIQGLLKVLMGMVMVLIFHTVPVAHADCMFDGNCSGGSGISVPGLGPGTPGYQNYNPTPVCVSNCGPPPTPSAPTPPVQNSYRGYRPATSMPTLTPMQSIGAGVVGGIVGSIIEDMFSGPSASDQQKAMQLKQEQARQQQLLQEERAAEARAKAAKIALEKKREEEIFLKKKKGLEQALGGVEGSLGYSTVDLSGKRGVVYPDDPLLGGNGAYEKFANHGIMNDVQNSLNNPGSSTITSVSKPTTPINTPDTVDLKGTTPGNLKEKFSGGSMQLSGINAQLDLQENANGQRIVIPSPQPVQPSWVDRISKSLNSNSVSSSYDNSGAETSINAIRQ